MTDATNSITKLHEDHNTSLARQIAAHQLLLWMSTSAQYARNADFYQNIVGEIGAMFGDAAKTSDDGKIGDDVLALKVPELVRKALDELNHYRLKEDAALYHLGG